MPCERVRNGDKDLLTKKVVLEKSKPRQTEFNLFLRIRGTVRNGATLSVLTGTSINQDPVMIKFEENALHSEPVTNEKRKVIYDNNCRR